MEPLELFDLLLRCVPAQLDRLTAVLAIRLRLDATALPGTNAPASTRATALFELLRQKGDELGLPALAEELRKLFPPLPPAAGAAPSPQAPPPAGEGGPEPYDILVLAANPLGTPRLRLEEDAGLIRDRLALAGATTPLVVRAEWAVRPEDLSRLLLRHDPVILHLGAHGEVSGDVVLEGADRRPHLLSPEALAGLLGVVRGRLECVVLSCCWSLQRADELLQKVRCVIGMAQDIDDESARRFNAGFYQALAFGRGYREAFELGRVEVRLANLPDADVPRFACSDPSFTEAETSRPRVSRSARGRVEERSEVPQYQLWFGTHRKPLDPANLTKGFSAERDRKMHYGKCQVAVPRTHRIGEMDASWWRQLLKVVLPSPDEKLRLSWASLARLDRDDFWADVRSTLTGERQAGKRQALVYLHGFNVTFENAALRTAQIGMDLKFQGVLAFYSWPSRGKLTGYVHDEASIDATEPYLEEFLCRFAADSGAERIHVLAHSMGNRAFLRVVQRVADRSASRAKLFGKIILAAPDVDADVFDQLAPALPRVSERALLYVSSKDRALATSGVLHDFAHAGLAPPVTVVEGVETIDVTNADLTLLGHGYYAEAFKCLNDIHAVLTYDAASEKRIALSKSTDGRHWVITP